MPVKKRFIAGAICPACKTLDVIQVYREGDVDYRECVQCGFADKMHFPSQARELETRVNVTDEQKQRETQTIKVIDFKPKSDD